MCLSEIPAIGSRAVRVWQNLNRKHRVVVDGQAVPGPNEEYLIYQTLVGAWPISVDRLQAYLRKAIHEAKVETSWINPATRYDEAVLSFAEAVLDPGRSAPFLADFTRFHARVAVFGALNSLAQVLVKVTAPGVPDFYQGTELWDLSLVDPDNRRPVEWPLRARLLSDLVKEIESSTDRVGLARSLLETREDGRIKLYLTRTDTGFQARAGPSLRTRRLPTAGRAGPARRARLCIRARRRRRDRADRCATSPRQAAGRRAARRSGLLGQHLAADRRTISEPASATC
jgi:(1->4)-alpha-D-glucan 1-alpha-D-glucosylmutase